MDPLTLIVSFLKLSIFDTWMEFSALEGSEKSLKASARCREIEIISESSRTYAFTSFALRTGTSDRFYLLISSDQFLIPCAQKETNARNIVARKCLPKLCGIVLGRFCFVVSSFPSSGAETVSFGWLCAVAVFPLGT